MNLINIIQSRRSVRDFTDEKVEQDKQNNLLLCAANAPSGHNYRPVHFMVFDKTQQIREFANIHPHMRPFKTAMLAIIVCAVTDISPELWSCDCGAAAENILIGAAAQGLSACWCGIYPKDEIVKGFKKVLELPDGTEPYCAIAVGYARKPVREVRPLEKEKVHHDKW